jgi:diguanylate cyclase (GGDEF)-like protein
MARAAVRIWANIECPDHVFRELDARHARQLLQLFPLLGPLFSLSILMFSAWDFWRDAANAFDALQVRVLLVALGALSYCPCTARFKPLYRVGFLYVTHTCALIVAEYVLQDGFLYGLAGITSCVFVASVLTLRMRTFLALVALPSILLAVLTVLRLPAVDSVNQLMLYLYALALAATLMYVVRSFRYQTLQLESQLLRSAREDSLTGVSNRGYLFELAESAVALARRHHRPLAVAMLDIDHFKQVNDRYGHPVGDSVIRALADTCVSELRTIDHFGRIGGEEFVCVMPETDAEEALRCAERLREHIGQVRVETPQGPLGFTVSIGVTVLAPGRGNWEKLLQSADSALYSAKNGGRNCCVLAA